MSKGRATSRRARREPLPIADSEFALNGGRYWFAILERSNGTVNAEFWDVDEKIETVEFESVNAMYVGFGEFVQRRNAEAPSAALH